MIKTGILLLLALCCFEVNATLCIAHRGDNHNFLENSMAAFRGAVEAQSDGVEYDVMHTVDGVGIIAHYKKLESVATHKPGHKCQLKRSIHKLTYREIADNCQLKNGEEIPTLEDVLSYFSDKAMVHFLELKDWPSPQSMELIEMYHHQNPQLLRVISFKKRYLKRIRKRYADSQFWEEVKMFNINRYYADLSSDFGLDIQYAVNWQKWVARKKGREVGVWTVDKAKKIKKMMLHKVDFVTSNDPNLCMSIKKVVDNLF